MVNPSYITSTQIVNIRSISVMMTTPLSLFLFIAMTTIPPFINGIVPPKTPVLSGFEPAAIGSYRELVCNASQPGAGTVTYKWYKYAPPDSFGNTWESKGPIGTSQKYVFSPVTEEKSFDNFPTTEQVSGKYLCNASNFAGARVSDWGDLYVYKPCSLYTMSVSPAKPAIGSTFTLNCYIPNPSGFAVNWIKKTDASSTAWDVAVANTKGCHAPDNTRYSWSSCSPPSTPSKTHTFNLQVTNAQPADFAYWICKDIGLSCDSNPVKPVVQAPPGTPQITGFPSGPVTAGTQLNLKCVASPTGDAYEWYKDGTKGTTSLSYDFQVTKESAGVYNCTARNAAGSNTSSDMTLVVYYKPDSVVVSSEKTWSSHAGEKDKFTCTVSGGYPTPTVMIYFKRSGGTPVEVTQGQDKVMNKEDNLAEYYCEAKVPGYPALDMTSSRKTYNVTFLNTKVSFLNNPATAVQLGQVVKFTCETDESNPITYIKWYQYTGSSWRDIATGISSSERNGTHGGKIRISEWSVTATKAMNKVAVRCTSTYSLTGHNFASNADTIIHVKWSATELKMVKKPSVPITAGVGVTIKCETDSSNPGSPETISWYRNGQQITTGITPSTRQASDGGAIYISELTFTARKEDNQAKYECKINDQVNFKKDVTITVHFPPNGIQLSETSITVKEGVTKTITCSTNSSSNPAVSGVSVKMRLGSSEVDVTGTSRVTNGAYHGKDVSIDIKLDTNRKDNGAQYICSFTYASTTFMKTATINVNFNPSTITITQKPPTSINEGKSFNIVCETDSANPVAKIQFHRKRTGRAWEQLTSGITSDVKAGEYNGRIRKSTLTVTADRLDTQAVFKCEVRDDSFQLNQTTSVNVYFPPSASVSSSPEPIKEGGSLMLTCTASGGNPTVYSYKWFYKNKEIPNEASKNYTINNIKYTESGTYRCQATNYSPNGKADGSLNIDILYKAKWNPGHPEVFIAASKLNAAMKFVLHVIANPLPTKVMWFFQNKTKVGEAFVAAKVNDTTYTLNKTSIGINDYGNYTVSVTNAVGISTFSFVLQRSGPPDTPCCLALVNATAVSITLTFTSGFAGGSAQTFTIENRTSGGNVWDLAVEDIADPGLGNNVTQKISGLGSDTNYEFRVNATNRDGDSGYEKILAAKTEAAPNVSLTVERKDNKVTVSWPKLLKEYTRIQIKYCQEKGRSCDYHDVPNPTSLKSSFTVKEGNTYTYSMKIFDGEDQVFVSAPVMVPSSGHPVWAIAGGVGGFIFFLIIIAVVLAVVFARKKKQAEKEAGILQSNNNGDANGGQVNPGFSDLDAGHNDVTDGLNPYEESMEMTSSPSSIQTVAGGAEYAVVKKGSKKPPVGEAYAEVDFKKKKGGKKGSAPPQPGQAYAEVDFSKKSKGKKGKDKTPVPPANPGGQAYAEVDFTKKTKKDEAPASPAGPGDVYAEVSKPKKPSKPTKPGKPGSDDQTVYANVPHGDEEDLYEDVRKEEPTENGYRQPKEAYQVGVDGTLYSQIHISPPKNPDVIRGKETIEEYASVDFSLQAPPLPEPEDPDDPNDPGFLVLIE